MSAEYKDQDPLAIAKQAERDLNSHAAKHGHGGSDSSTILPSLLPTHKPIPLVIFPLPSFPWPYIPSPQPTRQLTLPACLKTRYLT